MLARMPKNHYHLIFRRLDVFSSHISDQIHIPFINVEVKVTNSNLFATERNRDFKKENHEF
jgi:hypothetical protein